MAKLKNLSEQSRGLDELLSSSDSVTEIVRELSHTIASLPIKQIERNIDQPRTEFSPEALKELSESIKMHGLIQPITVRRLAANQYQIISGERRFRASQLAGLTEIPAYIRIADDQQMLEMALVENLMREDLNPMEVALTYKRLKEEFKFSDEQLGKRVDKNRSTVTNMLRLLKLPAEIQQSVKENKLSTGHAKVLAGVTDKGFQSILHAQIMDKILSVREAEDLVKTYNESKSKPPKKTPSVPDVYKPVIDNLNAFFGTKIKFSRKSTGDGQIIIKFKNDEDLNRILDRIEEKG
jgi:ParB family transcriptional regulator, chromosome partitioning protein